MMKINMLEYFEEICKKRKNDVAVIDRDLEITFCELRQRAIILAEKIELYRKSINCPIAVLLPKSINCIISDLAILYSGSPYMNLDIKLPVERQKNILDINKPSCIITVGKYLDKLENINIDIINLDHCDLDSVNNIVDVSYTKLIDTDPMCIINTSGSTGTPKGVILNHKSFIDFTEWSIAELSIGENEIIGSLSPSVFDIFSFELCMMMSKGSKIVIISENIAAFPAMLLEYINNNKVTFIFWVPTILVNIANMNLLGKIKLKYLKTVWFAGEVFPTKQFNYWKKNLPYIKYVNLYGPIEITLDCIYYIVDRELNDDESIPIGFPCRNTDILLLNENKLVSDGEIGEICVRGTSLSMGYYNNPEKTKGVFVQNPLNKNYSEIIYRTGDLAYRNKLGELIFKGRKDTLIKHMGYRIELSEIEHVTVNSAKLVKNCCVIYNKNKKQIVMLYENDYEIDIPLFRKSLLNFIPKYMIPTKYVYIEKMPMNTNGKIDRLLLSKKYS